MVLEAKLTFNLQEIFIVQERKDQWRKNKERLLTFLIWLIPQRRTEGHLSSCTFWHNEGWVTYDQARHLIRTDLSERLAEETAQLISEK